MNNFVVALVLSISLSTQAAWNFSGRAELGAIQQTQNDQAVPGNTGTRFSLNDSFSKALPTGRLYLSLRNDQNTEWRLLYAPLRLTGSQVFNQSINYGDQTFAPGVKTNTLYQFNSYRLSYIRHQDLWHGWNWAIGFTGKIRDAEVSLRQGLQAATKKNVGFVPLLHLQAQRELFAGYKFQFDFDGLAAPQGRAIDLALYFSKEISGGDQALSLGYRVLEGGADNDTVYNSALFQTVFVGYQF